MISYLQLGFFVYRLCCVVIHSAKPIDKHLPIERVKMGFQQQGVCKCQQWFSVCWNCNAQVRCCIGHGIAHEAKWILPNCDGVFNVGFPFKVPVTWKKGLTNQTRFSLFIGYLCNFEIYMYVMYIGLKKPGMAHKVLDPKYLHRM